MLKLTRRVTLRQLEVFCAAARQRNFSAVAETMSLTQPAISMQIRQLEQAVEMALFEKAGRGKVLTDAGRRLYEHASRILGEVHATEQSLLALKGLAQGSITVGMVSTSNHFAPRLLVQFNQQHPGIEVRIVVGNREALIKLLTENQADLALMGQPPGEIQADAEALARNPHVIVAPKSHPLAKRRRLELRDLRGETFLQREAGSGTRRVMEDLFQAKRFRPTRMIQLGSNETVKQAVMAGLGLSVLSLHTLALELRCGELSLLHVTGTPVMRTWFVVNLRRRPLTPAADAFRTFLIDQTQTYLDRAFDFL